MFYFAIMKKLFLSLVAAVSVAGAAHAQNIDLGLKLGANLSQLNGETWDGGYKANILGGAYAGFRAVLLGVQAEAFFTQSTYTIGKTASDFAMANYKNAVDSVKGGSFRLNQLSVPVLFQLKVAGPLWLQAGPQFTATLSSSDKDNLLKNPDDFFKKSSVDGVVGAQAILPFKLQAGVRYVFGLSGINSAEKVADSWKQRSFQIHIGYSFL